MFLKYHSSDTNLIVNNPENLLAFSSGTSPQDAIPVGDGASIELEDVDVDKLLDVNSAIAVEKEIAADTVGTIFAATREHFLPYVEMCVVELVNLLPHYYEGIRKSCTDSLMEIVKTFYSISGDTEWQPGVAVGISRQFPDPR
jgi:hypothetical protein